GIFYFPGMPGSLFPLDFIIVIRERPREVKNITIRFISGLTLILRPFPSIISDKIGTGQSGSRLFYLLHRITGKYLKYRIGFRFVFGFQDFVIICGKWFFFL